MDLSFLLSLLATLWDFLSGILSIAGWLGADSVTGLLGLLGAAA